MARKVAQSDVELWKKLRGEGHTYQKIGEMTKWDGETVRKYIGGEQKPRGEEKEELKADLEIEARTFTEFEAGKNPVDLVKAKICSADIAKELGEKYGELSGKKFLSESEIESLQKSGYSKGHEEGFVEAREKYSVKIPCAVCRKDMMITTNGLKEDLMFLIDSVIDGGFEFVGRGEKLGKWGWGHSECHEKSHS